MINLDRELFFWCAQRDGHGLIDRHGHSPDRELRKSVPAWAFDYIDGGFCPPGKQTEGLALLHHRDGWTVLAFWDRSGDSRGNSNAALLAKGEFGFTEMIQLARTYFAALWARFTFEIRLYQPVVPTPSEVRITELEGQLLVSSAFVAKYEAGMRWHRDQRGDDRCYEDDDTLYDLLPEGGGDPMSRRLCDPETMRANCDRFIAHRHNPALPYCSPQREIEALEAQIADLKARHEVEKKVLIDVRIEERKALLGVLETARGHTEPKDEYQDGHQDGIDFATALVRAGLAGIADFFAAQKAKP